MSNIQTVTTRLRELDWSWARLVSNLLSPPMVWAALAFPIAFREAESQTQALMWAVVYGVMVCLLPVLYIAVMVWRGKISDMHMRHRRERMIPFMVSLVCTTIAWWTLRFMGAPSVLPVLAIFTLVQIAIMTAITFVWQISMHTMTIGGAAMAIAVIFGTSVGMLFVPIAVLVSAARLKLKRHTPAQIIAGVLVGALVPALVLVVM